MPCLDDNIFKKYNVIIEKKIGLSVSRNLGIKHSSWEYIWFMDDDIILNNDAVTTVKKSLNKNHPDVLTVRTLFDNDSPYKNYINRISMKKLDIVNISSVEIIVSRSKLIKCKI